MRVVVTGGAGFIGSHVVDRLLHDGHQVTVVDNLTGGHRAFLAENKKSHRFRFIKLDVRQTAALIKAFTPRPDMVFHLAANANIARGVDDPTLDFEHSLVATFSVLQAMKKVGASKLIYTSGSGVYGNRQYHFSRETTGPLTPVSMYGAGKLGAEGLISAFAHLFNMQAWIVRPANIVGPRLTHGVMYDFVGQLRQHPRHLRILGNGQQSKSYLHVNDVIDALFLLPKKTKQPVNIFNLSSTSFITVNQIADLVIQGLGLTHVKRQHTPGSVGWRGDVPVVRLQATALRRLGWKPRFTSRQATIATIASLRHDRRLEAKP